MIIRHQIRLTLLLPMNLPRIPYRNEHGLFLAVAAER